ncbi:hypothetical protein TSAR_001807 [Trichomalopsis sarcophagae]|uniref:Reverse transcriptase domain-containing protein n=1 Tax=Trichomalopsis sarcophagae TaxID=543379 RepID=A0A232EJS9_9HYME|nr:hypothetical protein TSAR_001807 [Trichomalopsis sarcophagae]
MLEHAQKYASPIRAKPPLENTNACSTASHGELTEAPSRKNLSTIEQVDSEEESEDETFVHQNLPDKLMEENERLEQAGNKDSQIPVDDGARPVSTDINKQCPATSPLLGIAEPIAANTSLRLLSMRECVTYLKDNIVHFVPKDLNLSTSINNMLTDIIEYKKHCALVKKIIKQKKKDNLKKFAESLHFCSYPNYQKVEGALNKISPPWVQTDPHWMPRCDDNTFLNHPFDFVEFNVALESKNKKSSPGLDGIDFDIVDRLPLKFKLLLLDIYNEMYQKMNFPEDWQNVFVHLINKPDGDSVIPISLTSCLCKLFESLVKK